VPLAETEGLQAADRATIGDGAWPTVIYEAEPINLIFTTPTGSPMLQQQQDWKTDCGKDRVE
jgi:hypothetical protein